MNALADFEEHADAAREAAERLARWAHDERCERLGAEARVEWLVDLLAEATVIGGAPVRAAIERELPALPDSVRARFASSCAAYQRRVEELT